MDILVLCTGNICRSPMAEAMLRKRLEDVGVQARVHSAGLLQSGHAAAAHGVEVLQELGYNLSEHRSRSMTREMIAGADLVLTMAREHVREAALLAPDAWPRTFTLKELVRRGQDEGPRRPGETVAAWLERVHRGRDRIGLSGSSPADDVADPIGRPRATYERLAAELDHLLGRLVSLVWPPEVVAAEQAAEKSAQGPAGEPLGPDEELFSIIEREVERQNTTLQLIASENFTSPAVMAAQGSVLTNKYSEGYPRKRYYGGNHVVDEAEELARERAKALFGAEHANVQPHSGANANMAVYLALLQPGDTVMGMRLDQGGHLTHGSPVNFSGRLYRFVSYGVTESDERLDYDRIRDLALAERPKAIIAGATAYPRIIDPEPLRAICDEVGALFVFDAAHVAGLIAGGVHPNPVPYADVVTFTTHKTLRGPRAGCILCRAEHATAIDKAVFPGLQGGPLMHVIAAKAVAFREAAHPSFRSYAAQIVRNARALAGALAEQGFRLVSGGTDNHLMLVDLRTFDAELTGKVAQDVLDRAGITLNKNQIPGDPRSPFVTSGLRIGTPAVTTAGMDEGQMSEIAALIGRALRGRDDEAELADVRQAVATLCSKFMPYPGLAAGSAATAAASATG